MNVGEYIRTKQGLIGKLKYTGFADADSTPYYIETRKRIIWVNKCNVIKSSPQIIDLIEVGDYVNGDCVIEAVPKDKRKKQIIIVDSTCVEYGDLPLDNKDIKTIITHEQMEAMQYRVEE